MVKDRVRKIRNKAFLTKIKREIGTCQNFDCQDVFDPDNLSFYEFNHIDPATKHMDVCRMVKGTHSIKKIQEEINKCELLCSYCHAAHTKKQVSESIQEVSKLLIKKTNKNVPLSSDDVKRMRAEYALNPVGNFKALGEKYGIYNARHIIMNLRHFDPDYTPPELVKSCHKPLPTE